PEDPKKKEEGKEQEKKPEDPKKKEEGKEQEKKPEDPKKKEEGKEQEKKPEIKHLGKTLPEGRVEDEDTKDTLVSPSLPEATPDPKEDELLSNLTDEEIEEMFKLESLKKSLVKINEIKEQDLNDVLKSLKALIDKQNTPDSKEQNTPEVDKQKSPEEKQQKSPDVDSKKTPEGNQQKTPESKEQKSPEDLQK
ncbi:hypothetical protein ACWXVM_01950, partial [Mycoplasma sp. 2261]